MSLNTETEFRRGLGTFDSTMVVAGSMIGSGIFIVSAETARQVGSPGWLLIAWVIAGLLTITGALSYGELAGMMPKAGGQYVYLRESYSPLMGFLFGWTTFLVVQTGTIAAVAVAFSRFTGVLIPSISESNYLIAPIHIGGGYALSLSTAQLSGVSVIALLTLLNTRGLQYGKIIQNIFTTAKIGSLAAVILVGVLLGWKSDVVHLNFGDLWSIRGADPIAPGLSAVSAFGLFVALCVSQTGSLFSADAWNNITFTAGEVKDPRRTIRIALALGTMMVIVLYLLVNIAYLVTLPLEAIQHAPSDRVATAMLQAIFPGIGVALIAIAVMISTFGCINGLIFAGARAYYAMAKDRLFFARAGELNAAQVPAWGLLIQGIWAALLVLPRTYDASTGKYGNLYSNLLDYVISSELILYVATILAVFRLRRTQPNAERPYKAFGYPVLPAFYVIGATTVLVVLFLYRPATTWPGLVIRRTGYSRVCVSAEKIRRDALHWGVEMLYLNEDEVRQLLPMGDCVRLMRETFQALKAGTAINQVRRRMFLPSGSVLHAMAGASERYFGTKIYAVNVKHGFHFFFHLFDAETAKPLALMEANYLGQIRTGAASGYATDVLAKADAKTAGIIGSGFQARSQLEAILQVRKLETVRVWSRKEEKRQKFAEECSAAFGVNVVAAGSAEEAVRDADIVVTATFAKDPVVESAWIRDGALVNAMGSNQPQRRELPADLVARAKVIVVDSVEVAKVEAGDLLMAWGPEEWGTERLVELKDATPELRPEDGVVVFKSNGMGVEDVFAAGWVWERAVERGCGREV